MNQQTTFILGTKINALSWEQATTAITQWASKRESRMVCLCNVHVAISARSDVSLRAALDNSDMVTPDGSPLAWLMRKRGWQEQQRLSGPDLMWRTLAESERLSLSVYLYGSTESTLEKLVHVIHATFPDLKIAGALSPPFRTLSNQEESEICRHINQSGAHIVMVGLGCPKQEKWIAKHKGAIHAVMLGVGAAFDYHAGTLPRAPLSWQHAGLEWLYRLIKEPTRLFNRYVKTNTLFLLALPGELWRESRR